MLIVKDKHVKLLGALDTMEEYRVVDKITRFTFDVVDVDNLMTIDSDDRNKIRRNYG